MEFVMVRFRESRTVVIDGNDAGPTNETLGKYIRDLFVQMIPPVEIQSSRVSTQVITPSTRRSPKL